MTELVALYPRVSTQEQATDGYSIGEQTERMTKYCEAMGWKVYKVYTDAGFSGANINRPALQRMIKDVKAGKFSKVLVYKLDRLSRSQKDTLLLIEDIFLANKVDFVSMSENFDTSTPFGRAMVGILAVFAQLEREQIKERMNMGREARAKQGLFHGSKYAPIGYDYINGQLVTNEFEKMQIVKIFNDYANGKSTHGLVKELNQSGLTHKFGKWSEKAIRTILTKKTYLGYSPHKGEWHKGLHEVFISEELFETVQRRIEQVGIEHRQYNRRLGLANSYLGGYLVCGKCGGKIGKVSYYSGKDHKHKYLYYSCNSRAKHNKQLIVDPNCKNKNWRMSDLDNLVFGEIKKLVLDPSYIAEIKANQEEDTRPQVIQEELNRLDKQINRLIDLYAVGSMPMDILQNRIHDLNDRKESLNMELETILKENDDKLSQAETMRVVQSFGDVIERGDFDEIRAVISALIEKIVVNDDLVTIHWNFA